MAERLPWGVFGCRHAPLELPPDLVAALAAAYAEPQRAYHTAAHVAEVLGWFDAVADDVGWRAPREVYVAVVFHDAVYFPGGSNNEARSAAWAREAALPVDPTRVTELIELTANHGRIDHADHDAAHFLDSDMAILGAAPAAFDAYDAGIAAEYRHAPRVPYFAGRRAFLARLAASPRIFLTDYFHARLDAAARANLARAIARLDAL